MARQLLIHRNGTAVLVWRGSQGGGLVTARGADSVRGRFSVVPAREAVAAPTAVVGAGEGRLGSGGGPPGNPVVVDPHIMWVDEAQSYHVIGLEGVHYAKHDLESPWVAVGSEPSPTGGKFGSAFNGTVDFGPGARVAYVHELHATVAWTWTWTRPCSFAPFGSISLEDSVG